MAISVKIDASPGELIDKITILEIKRDRIQDVEKRENVLFELNQLNQSIADQLENYESILDLKAELKQINEMLWDIEDDIRDCERQQHFGDRFIELARSVYITNDKRAEVKKNINIQLGSSIIEEKSYATYQ